MIYIYQGEQNESAAVCTRNSTIGGTIFYLWYMSHKLSGQEFFFIPFRLIPAVSYPPSYDVFCLNNDDSISPFLTGSTSCGQTNVHLIPGEYTLEIFQQNSNSNLNPDLSGGIVYTTLANVVGENLNIPTTYSGNTNSTYIIYNPNND